jgi:hypothetical protein
MPVTMTPATNAAPEKRDRDDAARRVLPATGSLYELRTFSQAAAHAQKPKPSREKVLIF